jgi:hypothetical protein
LISPAKCSLRKNYLDAPGTRLIDVNWTIAQIGHVVGVSVQAVGG